MMLERDFDNRQNKSIVGKEIAAGWTEASRLGFRRLVLWTRLAAVVLSNLI